MIKCRNYNNYYHYFEFKIQTLKYLVLNFEIIMFMHIYNPFEDNELRSILK